MRSLSRYRRTKKTVLVAVLVAILVAVCQCVVAGDSWGTMVENVQVGGYAKSLNVSLQSSPLSGVPSGFMTSNQQWFNAKADAWHTSMELSVENTLVYSDAPLSTFRPYTHHSVNRRFDLEGTIYEETYSEDTLSVQRLNLRKSFGKGELIVGRQVVGLGRMLLFSPLDVFDPFSPEAIDTDERSGIDAVRFNHYWGLGGEVGGVVVFGDSQDNNAYLLNFSRNAKGVDLWGTGGSLHGRAMAGFGVAGHISGIGLKAEVTVLKGKNVSEQGGDLRSSFTLGGIELWYRFESGVNFLVEYLYNGAGAGTPEQYLLAKDSAANQEGLASFLGRQYLLFAPSYSFTPLIDLEVLGFWNLEDGSILIRPLLSISIADNLDLQLFWAMTDGRKPSAEAPGILRSEFGSMGDYGGIYVKYFF